MPAGVGYGFSEAGARTRQVMPGQKRAPGKSCQGGSAHQVSHARAEARTRRWKIACGLHTRASINAQDRSEAEDSTDLL